MTTSDFLFSIDTTDEITISRAVELSCSLGRAITASPIRRACSLGSIVGAHHNGSEWRIPRIAFVIWMTDAARHKRGHKPNYIPSLSRSDQATITYSEWVHEKKEGLYWLTIKTDLTGELEFRRIGSDRLNLRANQMSDWAKQYDLGKVMRIGQLHTIPVVYDTLANIESGVNMHLGIMDDGLFQLCGTKLVFSRFVNMTGNDIQPTPEMEAVSREAAILFGRQGRMAAEKHLLKSGLFKSVYQFDVGGPSLLDPCVFELK